jgi:uncharacterized membrane protein (UPF0127 family)
VPWLVRDERVLATLEVAETFRERSRGLLGRDGIEGAILLRPARQVHSFGMRFALDVAFCTGGPAELVVARMVSLPPGRITRPSLRCRCVIEAEAGAFGRWALNAGDHLEVRA